MKKPKMLFTAETDGALIGQIDQLCDVTYCGWNTNQVVLGEDELIQQLKEKEILVTSYDKVTRKVLEASPDLKLVVCGRANPVNVDCVAAKELGIVVAYTPGRNSDVTAEFAVAMLLSLVRNVTIANKAILDGEAITDNIEEPTEIKKDVTWGKVKDCHPYDDFKGPQIRNKTMGIVGYGSIGRRVGSIMHHGFLANLLVYDPYLNAIDIDEPGVQLVDFDTLVRQSDFISCHIKVTPETTGLFNYETFKKMKRTAYYINNSRGAVVNENDLCRALDEHLITGAALDVYAYEPLYKGHPFITRHYNNLLMTPHISGSSADATTNGTKMIIGILRSYLAKTPIATRAC